MKQIWPDIGLKAVINFPFEGTDNVVLVVLFRDEATPISMWQLSPS